MLIKFWRNLSNDKGIIILGYRIGDRVMKDIIKGLIDKKK